MICRPAPVVLFAVFSLLVLLVAPVHAGIPILDGPSPMATILPAGIADTGSGQDPIIPVLATFLAVVILGVILVARREQKKGMTRPLWFWLATISGLFYLGGSAVVVVHLFREISTVTISPLIPFTILYTLIPAALGIWALRLARCPTPDCLRERLFIGLIGLLGILFWSGFIIGPILAMGAALVPIRWRVPTLPGVPGK